MIIGLFTDKSTKPSKKGYTVRLCVEGLWEYIKVDDKFPCCENNDGVHFRASSNGPEIWVLLLEKAVAKLGGGYLSLIGGHEYEAFMLLTGTGVRLDAFDCFSYGSQCNCRCSRVSP